MWKPIEIVNHFSVFSTFFVKSGNLQVSGNQNILKSGNIANKNMVYKIVSTLHNKQEFFSGPETGFSLFKGKT